MTLRTREPEPQSEGLQRQLQQRQLSMIAIGGAIGVGLFLGSSVTVQLAGPGVIISYLLGAVLALIVAYALAEMAVVHPVAGSFGVYADRYLHSWAGFSVRVTYALIQVIAIGAEVTAVAIYARFWFPGLPQWACVAAVSLLLIGINGLQVSRFGEVEYWFAMIKVVAIIAFIGVGTLLIVGVGPLPPLGLRNLTEHGGFLPRGWWGVWAALTLAVTSYMGVEVIAVTAGEAKDPARSIPKAMRTIVFRLIAFYVLAITVMLAITSWQQVGDGQVTGSPFVRAFASVGIPYAAGIMNLVVISAALSSANTNLYLSTRMLFSLARDGYIPAPLARVRRGVPVRALALSALGMVAAILMATFAPDRAFLALYGTAVAGMFFVWTIVLVTHVRFRRRISPETLAGLPVRLPGHAWATVVGVGLLLAIAVTTLFVDGLRYTLVTFLLLLGVISIAYLKARARLGNSPKMATLAPALDGELK